MTPIQEPIGLDKVHDVYEGYGLPEVRVDSRPRGWQLVEDLSPLDLAKSPSLLDLDPSERASAFRALRRQLRQLASAVREDAEPTNVLHALVLEDSQTIGQLAAKMHGAPLEFEGDLQQLVVLGLVVIEPGPLPRYSLSDDAWIRPE